MDWKLRDVDRIALFDATRYEGPLQAKPGESLADVYAERLGKLKGIVRSALLNLERLEPEPEPEPDSTPELDIF